MLISQIQHKITKVAGYFQKTKELAASKKHAMRKFSWRVFCLEDEINADNRKL